MSQALAGEIRYYDHDRAIRGREVFIVRPLRDGWSLLAECVILSPRLVERSVSYKVDRIWQPVSATVEVSLDGVSMPAALYSFDEGLARMTTGDGVSTVALQGPLDWFGAHPIVMDGWITSHALAEDQREAFRLGQGLTSSVEHDGASPAGLKAVTVHGRYLGTSDVTVEAGCFTCHAIEMTFGEEFREPHPPYTMWVRATPDRILVRAEIPEFGRTYELARLVPFDLVTADPEGALA